MYMVQIAILEATNCPSRLRVICDVVSSANTVKPVATMPPYSIVIWELVMAHH